MVQAAGRDRHRAFWQRFFSQVRFDHSDQPPPGYGARNWVKIDLPSPARWLRAYRSTGNRAGLFLTLGDEAGASAFAHLHAEAVHLREETGLDLVFKVNQETPFRGEIPALRQPVVQECGSDRQLFAWFTNGATRMVNALRPRLGALRRHAME